MRFLLKVNIPGETGNPAVKAGDTNQFPPSPESS